MFIIKENLDYNKIRGILVLIGAMLFYFAIMMLISICSNQIGYFTNGSFSSFINKSSANYDPVLAVKLITDIVFFTALFIFCVYLIIFFFKKRRSFPKLLIIFLVFHFSIFLIDYIMINAGINHSKAFDSAHFLAVLYKNLILFIIVIVYLLESERVGGTFIR